MKTEKEKDHGTDYFCTDCSFSEEGNLLKQCKECMSDEIYYDSIMDDMNDDY
jgi:hypothetical protein|tara:strand:+ start:413 stop:568 length:156 start_codon:yes stop_codon:yes gene_type:complete